MQHKMCSEGNNPKLVQRKDKDSFQVKDMQGC